MDTEQIGHLLLAALDGLPAETRAQYTGVCAADQLVRGEAKLFEPGKRRVCIVNTDPSDEAGTHWFTLGVDARDSDEVKWFGFVFDSLALNARAEYRFACNHLATLPLCYVLRNRFATQDSEVDSCALHAMYMITMLLKENLNFEQALGTFDSECALRNDCALLENFNSFVQCKTMLSSILDLNNSVKDTHEQCKAAQSQ